MFDLSPEAVEAEDLAGEAIHTKLTRAPGNNAPIGGLKIGNGEADRYPFLFRQPWAFLRVSLLHRTWFRLPNLGRILGNSAVARKLATAGDVQNGSFGPRAGITIQRAEPVLRLAIRCQIR